MPYNNKDVILGSVQSTFNYRSGSKKFLGPYRSFKILTYIYKHKPLQTINSFMVAHEIIYKKLKDAMTLLFCTV